MVSFGLFSVGLAVLASVANGHMYGHHAQLHKRDIGRRYDNGTAPAPTAIGAAPLGTAVTSIGTSTQYITVTYTLGGNGGVKTQTIPKTYVFTTTALANPTTTSFTTETHSSTVTTTVLVTLDPSTAESSPAAATSAVESAASSAAASSASFAPEAASSNVYTMETLSPVFAATSSAAPAAGGDGACSIKTIYQPTTVFTTVMMTSTFAPEAAVPTVPVQIAPFTNSTTTTFVTVTTSIPRSMPLVTGTGTPYKY